MSFGLCNAPTMLLPPFKKDANFDFDESCKSAFEEIKSRLVSAPIMLTPNWSNEFEIMCDDSDYAMGAVL